MWTKWSVGSTLLSDPTSTSERTGRGLLLTKTPIQLPSFLTQSTPCSLIRIRPHLAPTKTDLTLVVGVRTRLHYRNVPPVVPRKLGQSTGPSRQLRVPIPQSLRVHRLKVAAKTTWALVLST